MRKIIQHFRLLVIVIAVAIVLFLQWRSHVVINIYRDALYSQWAQGIEQHEMTIKMRIERKLAEPFVVYDSTIDQFVSFDMDVDGFRRWLAHDAVTDPLIGAGFVWRRGADTLMVLPLSEDLNSNTTHLLDGYLDTKFHPEYNLHPRPPDSIQIYLDSLKQAINRDIGFSIYNYSYYPEIKDRRQRTEAIKVVLGVIWNFEHYRDEVLPILTDQIISHRQDYELHCQEAVDEKDSFYNGILIIDMAGDSIYHYGRVQLEPDSIFSRYAAWQDYFARPLGRTPGWRLYVHDHWQATPYVSGMMDDWRPSSDRTGDRREALRMIKLLLTMPWLVSEKPPLILLSLALGTLFIIIAVQIIARNRQRDFIAHVSHELRTPVANVKLYAETLRHGRTVSEEKEDEYLDVIMRESDHLSVLIDNTLNLARLDAGQMKVFSQPVNLKEWLGDFYQAYCAGLSDHGFEVKMVVEDHLSQINADPSALKLAMKNLLDNAVKYSGEEQEILIKAARGKGNAVRLEVADRGIGIPSDKRKAIFRRFYRVKPTDQEPVSGVGVGLSLVKEIVSRFHGKVWCEARSGGGSRFIIELPATKRN